ncbi:hypothetical protein PCL_12117 [Purpureocillium lilacinum]|uniref:Metallopeptidase, catalytic domain-containingprotein n=1 Tax=Purpureocillium lilacinum TaxID=33203 RepID=A0A2U3DPF4_PURLI|nr:hypothetical protein PCL_12117 [Purpureocillium lilacinum]
MFRRSIGAIGLGLLLSVTAVDAAPADAKVQARNRLGTSLTDFIGCKSDNDNNQKDFIKQAYKEAHTIVDVDGVKANIHWDSEAAVDFFGPPQFNKDQQGQIQAVLANVETVQPGYWWNPFGHSLQVRCDDPKANCRRGVTAYTLNPRDNEKPYVNFCPGFFNQYALDKAVNNYKDDDNNPEIKWNVDNYMNRGLIFLHELFHVDLAANSEKGEPNPKIFDISIRYNDTEGNIQGPRRAYYARFSKLLARFLPSSRAKNPKSTGYWVQRNVDNFSRYAMAKYLEGKLGGYPFLPLIYDKLLYPLDPGSRPGKSSLVAFHADKSSDAKITVDTSDIDDDLEEQGSIDSTHTTDDVFEIGEPIGADEYPESYREAYARWLDILRGKNKGICKVEVKEIWTCEDFASNLYASIKITDASGKTVYTTPGSTHSPGQPINDGHPLKLKKSGMDSTLTMVGQHTNDYIQFSYGSTSWTSTDTDGDASCKLVGNNWDKDGPKGCPNAMAVVSFLLHAHQNVLLTIPERQTRTFECQYPCSK